MDTRLQGPEARLQVDVGAGRFISAAEQGMRNADARPPIVLLHGIPGSSASWAAVAARLPREERILVPDLIGFGKSSRSLDAETLHANGQADALVRCLDALSVPRAILVGHDFGGPVALTVWARFPNRVAGIGLLSTNAFADAPIPFPLSMATWPFLGRWARKGLFSAPALRWMLRIGLRTPGVTVDPRAAIGDRHQALAIATIFSASLTRLQELYGPVQEALRSLSVPAFVAWGDCDPFFSVEQGRRTAGAIQDSRFSLLDGAGHFLAEERPDDVAMLITALASRVGSRDAEVAAANSALPARGPSDGAATTRRPGASKIS